jgi:DNA-directed RNA polymerase subunit RPC12/RpoP
MDIQVEQGCPQCGAPVTLSEDDRLLICPYCGVRNFLQTSGAFHYVLPDKVDPTERRHLLYAPYIRLKTNLFHITEKGIAYKIIDTTQLGFIMPGLPPSLGMRPQTMKAGRLTPKTEGRFLRLSVKAKIILEKAVNLSKLSNDLGKQLLHRAYIGDTVSLMYLPLLADDTHLFDAVTDTPLITLDRIKDFSLKGTEFNPRWKVNFLPTLCPKCGWDLEGDKDCLVPTCHNCDTAWEISKHGLQRVAWDVQPGDQDTPLYLPFWKISAQIPAMEILSFADFIHRTNQPVVPRPQWHERKMQFWIPAFKLRPKIFLQIARQVTISHWRLHLEQGRSTPNLYPVNLPKTEARQAVKVVLAACATSPQKIFPYLPEARIKKATVSLAYLPFQDKGHDWVQPQTGAVISKSVLRFGRRL